MGNLLRTLFSGLITKFFLETSLFFLYIMFKTSAMLTLFGVADACGGCAAKNAEAAPETGFVQDQEAAEGEMYGEGYGEEPMMQENDQYDPDYKLTKEMFLEMEAEEFWNEALYKLMDPSDPSKLDQIIAELTEDEAGKEHLQ